jgi:hypothetical protein
LCNLRRAVRGCRPTEFRQRTLCPVSAVCGPVCTERGLSSRNELTYSIRGMMV